MKSIGFLLLLALFPSLVLADQVVTCKPKPAFSYIEGTYVLIIRDGVPYIRAGNAGEEMKAGSRRTKNGTWETKNGIAFRTSYEYSTQIITIPADKMNVDGSFDGQILFDPYGMGDLSGARIFSADCLSKITK